MMLVLPQLPVRQFNTIRICALLATIAFFIAPLPQAHAAAAASDSACNYGSTWTNGNNFGTGFGPWGMSPLPSSGNASYFISSAANNGANCTSGEAINGSCTNSWGMYANNNTTANARRPFTTAAGTNALQVRQTFAVSFDNGNIDSLPGTGTVGIALENVSSNFVFQFYFRGGSNFYSIADNLGNNGRSIGIPFTADGMNLSFTLTSPTNYSFSVTTLTSNTTYNFSGTISNAVGGKATVQFRAFNFQSATNNNCQQNAFWDNLSITCPALSFATQPTNLSVCTGNPAKFTALATNAASAASYQWQKAGTNLVNGGTISGATSSNLTVSSPGPGDATNYTCVVTDACGNIATSSVAKLTVISITISPTTLPNVVIGVPYSQTLSANGGTGPYAFSIISNALPAGLSLNASSGVITGTYSGTTGSVTVTTQAIDQGGTGCSSTRNYTVNMVVICPTISLSGNPAPGTVATTYSDNSISASNGTSPYRFSISGGSLPNGLILNSANAVISGLPTRAGTFGFTVLATDTNGCSGTSNFSSTINCPTIAVSPATLPNGTTGVAYSRTCSASGGDNSFTFSVSSGALPTGLSLNSTNGVISGTPTNVGAYVFTITATDTSTCVGANTYGVSIKSSSSTNQPLALQIPTTVPLATPLTTNGSDLILTWLPVAADIYGNPVSISYYNVYSSTDPTFAPDLNTYTNRVGSTNATTFVHRGAYTNASSLFYYVSAVGTNGSESLVFSNLAVKLSQSVVVPPGSNAFTWLALPPAIVPTNASSLAAQLGITGKLHRLNETDQSDQVWDAGAGTGTNFPLLTGVSYVVELTTSTVLRITGMYGPPSSFTWQYNTNALNHHWISVPPNSMYPNATALASNITACTKVAIYNSTNRQFASLFQIGNTWTGSNFVLNPAQGTIVSISSNATWQPQPEYPQVAVNLQSSAGFIDLTTLQATGTTIAGASPIVQYAWDYYGDGAIEQSNSTPISLLSAQLTNAGTIYPTYQVKDARGFYGIAYAPYLALSMSLSFSNQAFRAGLGETGAVCYASSTNGYFSAYIYDASTNLVRVLQSNVWQQAGTACVQWDGRNTGGTVVSNGAYYVVVDQTINGSTLRYDPRPLLLGSNVTSSVSGFAVQNQFNPYTGGLFPIQYTLPTPSQVTIVIQDNSFNNIAVVCSNVFRLAGSQVEYWNGQLSNGNLIAANQTFQVVLTAIAVGGNSLIVQSALPSLTALSASVTKFTPSLNPYGLGTNSVTVSYTLDRAADARIVIANSTGNVVQNALDPGKSPGSNTTVWTGADSQGRLVPAGIYSIAVAPEVAGQDGVSQTIWVQTYY